MADYKISIGAELRTGEIDAAIQKYKGEVNIGANTAQIVSDINETIQKYKGNVNVGTLLNVQDITNKIKGYKAPKKIHVESDFDTSDITDKINSYTPPKPIRVDVELTKSSINQQIRDANPTEQITIKAKLDDNAIVNAIKEFNSPKVLKLDVEPNFDYAETKISGYTLRNKVNVGVNVLKQDIINKIKEFQTEENDNYILLKAKLVDNAISSAISDYKTKHPDKIKMPIDLTLGSATQFDQKVKSKIDEYKGNPVEIQVKLKPATKGFENQITKTPIKVNVELNDSNDINNIINSYSKTPVPIAAKLIPHKNFLNGITKNPITIEATLNPDEINQVIQSFAPTSKINVDVKLNPKNVNTEVTKLPNPTEPISVNVDLNESSINQSIALFKPTATLGVNPDLILENVDEQIRAYTPKAKINVNVKIDDNDIDAETGKQREQPPITVNVKLDREKLNEQIRNFKTNTKIKVGVKLDFASHKDETGKEIQKGIAQQIKAYQTKAKVRLGVLLNTNDVEQQIGAISTTTPVNLHVQLDPTGVQNIQNEINNIRQQLQNLGNININLGGNGRGGGNAGGGNGNGTGDNGGGNGARGINDVTRAYQELISLQNRIGSRQKKILNLDATEDARQILSLSNTIDNLVRRYQQIHQLFNGQFNDIQTDRLNRGFQTTSESLEDIRAKAADARAEMARVVSVKLENGTFDKHISMVENSINGLTNVSSDVQREMNNVRAAFAEVENAYANNNIDALITANERYEESLKAVKNQLDINKLSSGRDKSANNIIGNLIDLEYDNQVDKVNSDFNKLSTKSNEARTAVNNLNQALADMEAAANTGDVDGLIRANERYVQSLKNAKNEIAMQQRSEKDFAATYKDDVAELQIVADKIDKIRVRIAKLGDKPFSSNEIDVLTADLNELESAYQRLSIELNGKLSSEQLTALGNKAFDTEQKLKEVAAQIQDTKEKLASGIKTNIDNGKLKGELNGVIESFKLLRIEDKAVQDDITRLQTLLSNMDESDDIESVNSDYQEFLQLLQTVKNKVGELNREQNNASEMLDLKKESAMMELNNLFEDGSQAAKKFGARAKELAKELNACGNANVDNVTTKIKNLGKEIKKSGLQTRTLTTRLKEQFSKYSQYLSIASVIMYTTQAMRSMFEQVKLIDSAMTELKKVTDETDESYNRFLSNAATRAKEIGTTIDGLVSSTADFARLGYDFKDAQGLAEVANIYAVVGDEVEGVEGATESLISTMAAFKDEMGDMSDSDFAMDIIDKFNEVGKLIA